MLKKEREKRTRIETDIMGWEARIFINANAMSEISTDPNDHIKKGCGLLGIHHHPNPEERSDIYLLCEPFDPDIGLKYRHGKLKKVEVKKCVERSSSGAERLVKEKIKVDELEADLRSMVDNAKQQITLRKRRWYGDGKEVTLVTVGEEGSTLSQWISICDESVSSEEQAETAIKYLSLMLPAQLGLSKDQLGEVVVGSYGTWLRCCETE